MFKYFSKINQINLLRSHHYTESLADRQESMLQNYLFTCDCAACECDYSMFRDLKRNEQLQSLITDEDRAQLEVANKEYARLNWQRFAGYLEQYDHLYPCRELNEVQHHFRESLHILADNISIKLKRY